MELRTALGGGFETLREHPSIAGAIGGVVLIDAALRGIPILTNWLVSGGPRATETPGSLLMTALVVLGVQIGVTLFALVAGPFVISGLLGLIDARRRDRPIDAAIRLDIETYLAVLGWILGIVVIQFVIGFVAGIVGTVGIAIVGSAVVATTPGTASSIDPGVLVLGSLAGILGSLLGTIPVILTQYYPAAAVLDDRSPVDALRSAWTLLRDHPRATLALDAIVIVPLTVAQGVGAAVPLVLTRWEPSAIAGHSTLFGVVPALALALVGVIVWPIALPAYVALYRSISG
ncbi:MAG: hypothetical protein ABEJ86_03915 [Halococcoides sp.]